MNPQQIKDFVATQIVAALKAGTPKNKWCPQDPHPRQQLFLSLGDTKEAFYGGAAGGGKSSCLLMAALEYVDIPGYSALLLRRTFSDLSKPGALMDRAQQWLSQTSARWNETKKQWTFPSGATLTFGYMENENDKYQYLGAEYQFIGFDEVTQFSEGSYTYLFSRLRRLTTSDVPLRVRAASNPGGLGANWVYERFIPDGFTPKDALQNKVFWKETADANRDDVKRAFVPARISDNPSLEYDTYVDSLQNLDPVTREQMLEGDWQISERGDIYPMWNELFHVISWDQFSKHYGVTGNKIPSHWLRSIFMDCGTTEGHPNVTSWFATAPENAPLSGSVFLYRGTCVYNQTVREIADSILKYPASEREKITQWKMSHEANSERISFNRDFGLPFSSWRPDKNRGIAQVRNYLEIRAKDRPHPFKPQIKGRPSMYLIVDDAQLNYAKDDTGLARWRAEFPQYHYKNLTSGNMSVNVMPYPLFNDAMDTVRAAGADYFSPVAPLTMDEKVEREMSLIYSGRTFNAILELPPAQRGPAIDAWRIKESEVRKRQEGKLVKSQIVKWRKRRH